MVESSNLRVVIVDDVSTHRQVLSMVLRRFDGVECVGEFLNGRLGLEGIIKLMPDLVFLDIEMPEMDGIEVLAVLSEKYPDIGVIMVSGFDKKNADVTVKALELGAIDFVQKPQEKSLEESMASLEKKIAPLVHVFSTRKNLKRIKSITSKISEDKQRKEETLVIREPIFVKKTPAERVQERLSKEDTRGAPFPIGLLAIGASTGGPYALAEVIPKIPANFPVPIVIVQHMPANFTASLAGSLTKKSKIIVKEAQNGDVLTPGMALLAPGGFHMTIKKVESEKGKYVIQLTDTPHVHGCRPSVDVLFKSIAEQFRGNVLSLVMTGMGSDGAEGVRTLKNKKCYSLIQSEQSCVVYGMPKAVAQLNLVDEIIDLENIGQRIVDIIKYSK